MDAILAHIWIPQPRLAPTANLDSFNPTSIKLAVFLVLKALKLHFQAPLRAQRALSSTMLDLLLHPIAIDASQERMET
jgi:hypothetical protein